MIIECKCGLRIPMQPHEFPAGGLQCSCGVIHQAPDAAPEERPPAASADVLILHSRVDIWHKHIMREIPLEVLRQGGIKCAAWTTCHASAEELADVLRTVAPLVVLNQAMAIKPDMIRQMRKCLPWIRWVTLQHSAVGDLGRAPGWLLELHGHLTLAAEDRSCSVATPCHNLVDAIPAIQWIPNPIIVPATLRSTAGTHISLWCDARPLKNATTQMAAIALVQRKVKMPAILGIHRGQDKALRAFSESLGLLGTLTHWLPHGQFMEHLELKAAIGLQASFCESFNYVAMDHLVLGIPVVGSPSIAFLPPEWHASPHSPSQIARAVLQVLRADPELLAKKARRIADRTADINNPMFVEAIDHAARN